MFIVYNGSNLKLTLYTRDGFYDSNLKGVHIISSWKKGFVEIFDSSSEEFIGEFELYED